MRRWALRPQAAFACPQARAGGTAAGGLWLVGVMLLALLCHARAQPALSAGAEATERPYVIDLPAALQLAGARSLDIQLARERLAEAQAAQVSARWQFLPWLAPGVGYRRHDNLIQDVQGNVIKVHKDSYTLGPVINAQVDLGDALYKNLATRQLARAAAAGLESQRQDTVLAAAAGYFDLARAQGAAGVAEAALAIAENYASQVARAVEAGIAFKGEALRAQVQVERNRLARRQAHEQQHVAAARLAQVLRLAAGVELTARDRELVPLALVATNASLAPLLAQALASRPELTQSRLLSQAAQEARRGVRYGPLIPTLGAQVFLGGLGGGRDGATGAFGESEDYQFTLGWRLGPGGLFDWGRVRTAEARVRIADLSRDKLLDEVSRQVTESFTRWRSLADQLPITRRAVAAAEEALRLAEQRKEFAVGVVLETILSEQELTRARLEQVNTVAEYNKAQYALQKAAGALRAEEEPQAAAPQR